MKDVVKVHRVTLIVTDFDDLGAEGVASVLESTRYPNRCISPDVTLVETREVVWRDDHPINMTATAREALHVLFASPDDASKCI